MWFNLELLSVNIFAAFLGGWLIYAFFDKPVNRWRAQWLKSRLRTPGSAN